MQSRLGATHTVRYAVLEVFPGDSRRVCPPRRQKPRVPTLEVHTHIHRSHMIQALIRAIERAGGCQGILIAGDRSFLEGPRLVRHIQPDRSRTEPRVTAAWNHTQEPA